MLQRPVSITTINYLALSFLWIFLSVSCSSKNNNEVKEKPPIAHKDTLPAKVKDKHFGDIPDFHISQPFFADTKQLQLKRNRVRKSFVDSFSGSGATYDTLVDINYDGYRDYILGYYGGSGTGLKYLLAAYIFSKAKGNYFLDEQISNLVNPSFFIPKHTITGFYIGLGGGWGVQLEWIKRKWVLTKEFDVDNNGDSTVWKINYPLKKKTDSVIKPFQMVPPGGILETNDYL